MAAARAEEEAHQVVIRDWHGRFAKGHEVPNTWKNRYRKIHEDKHYSRRTEFKGNHLPWNAGKAWPVSFRKKMSTIQKHNLKILNHPNVKKSQFKKGVIPWNKNKRNVYSKGTIEKIQKGWFKKGLRTSPKTEFKKGLTPWNKGRPWSEEFRKKQSVARKQLMENNPELLRKMLIFSRPNKTERRIDDLLQKKFPGMFKFVGDGSLVIDGMNPDWICTDKKIIIELFGERWHEKEEERKRMQAFANYGFRTLIIWWKESRNEKIVFEKINNFIIKNNSEGSSGGW